MTRPYVGDLNMLGKVLEEAHPDDLRAPCSKPCSKG